MPVGNPNWKKGKGGNPNGRPANPIIAEMRAALEKAQKGQDKTLIEHFFARAYEDDKVLIAALKKLLPDLSQMALEATAEKFRIIIESAKKPK